MTALGCQALRRGWPPSPAQDSAILTALHAHTLASPREDLAAQSKIAWKAAGGTPWNLLSPSAFRDSEFPGENGQSAPQTEGHTALPCPTALLRLRSTGTVLEMPFVTSTRGPADKPRLGTQRSLGAMRSLAKMNQMSHFQDIKIVYKSSQFLFHFE